MTQPTPYVPAYNFTSFQASFPTTPLPAVPVDAELAAIKLTTDQIRTNLAILQRDDTALANAIVTPDSLAPTTTALIGNWNPRGAWANATAYAVKDMATSGGVAYVCTVAHTSSGSINLSNFMSLGLNAAATGLAQWGGTSAGTANAQTIGLTPALGAYTAGVTVAFKAGFTNTSALTLNVSSLGAKNVFMANAACTGGEIVSGLIYELAYDGTQFQMISPQSTQRGSLIGLQKFTAAGTSTYTPTVGTSSVLVEVRGAGGGGGGISNTAGNMTAAGGGEGGRVIKRITSSFSGVTVTVGAGGTAGSTAGGNGATGGTSSFGALASATGGNGGFGTTAAATPRLGGSGGSGSSGDLNLKGSSAMPSDGTGISGSGAGEGGGVGTSVSNNTGNAGSNGGGGGGAGGNSSTGIAGGAGGDGWVIVWEYN